MKRHLLFAVFSLLALFGFRDLAWPQGSLTVVPLNTGYNHSVFGPYPSVLTPVSGLQDRDSYWITIASFPPISPPVDRSWNLQTLTGWAPALPSTNWIGPRNSSTSAPGTNPQNPSYALFRKCFCLLPNFKDAKLNFQLRADDKVQVWLNTATTQLVAPTVGNHNGPVVRGSTKNQSHFQVGKNCLYVLVEDTFGVATGFDLEGSFSASGLLPLPASGVAQTFGPCQCSGGGSDHTSTARADDKKVIAEIVKLAEKRRLERRTPR